MPGTFQDPGRIGKVEKEAQGSAIAVLGLFLGFPALVFFFPVDCICTYRRYATE